MEENKCVGMEIEETRVDSDAKAQTENNGSGIEAQNEDEPLTLSEREELEQLREEKARSMKERLYDKVTISVKTLDRIIAALVILFFIVVIAGIFAGK